LNLSRRAKKYPGNIQGKNLCVVRLCATDIDQARHPPVGAGEACDLLIFSGSENGQDQKIAACVSSYTNCVHPGMRPGISAAET
jgi:hypothetical protein